MSSATRVAVVTGAGRGIGAATASALAEAGFAVVLAARSREQVERQSADLTARGREARGVVCDVTSEASVQALAREADKLGPVAVLVNNAGAAGSMPLARTSLEEWNRLIAVNATGAFLCTRAFLPGMLERKWGRVVNLASTAGLTGAKYLAAYTAAKHALVGLTRSTAAEVAGTGVTANAVCPGFVDTEMTAETVARIVAKTGRSSDEALAAALASAGQTRLISAGEVAAVVVSLAADAATHPPNGEALVLDGRDSMSGRFAIVNPEELGAPKGWSNGMLAQAGGRMLFIAGQTARDDSGKVPLRGFRGPVRSGARQRARRAGRGWWDGGGHRAVHDLRDRRRRVPREPQAARRGIPPADGDALSGNGAGGGELAGGSERGGGDRGNGGGG